CTSQIFPPQTRCFLQPFLFIAANPSAYDAARSAYKSRRGQLSYPFLRSSRSRVSDHRHRCIWVLRGTIFYPLLKRPHLWRCICSRRGIYGTSKSRRRQDK
ncbi:unnamed protein product, partial [Musa textilis]